MAVQTDLNFHCTHVNLLLMLDTGLFVIMVLFIGEYCAASNLETIMFTQCFLPTYFMTVGSWEGADCK